MTFAKLLNFLLLVQLLLLPAVPVHGIVLEPTEAQVAAALQRGRQAAEARTPPDRLYAWFGSTDELMPRGFLMTKLVGLAVMATHFALRSETPTNQEIRQILDEPTLLINAIIFGPTPRFAADSYMLLTQGDRTIKPLRVRFDGQANRSPAWPQAPAFQAKVVGSFSYGELDPLGPATLSIFPGQGGEIRFDLDFSQIE